MINSQFEAGLKLPVTYHVVITFDRDVEGDLKPGEAREVMSPIVAERRARALALEHAGALAFSRTGDPTTGEFQDAVILAVRRGRSRFARRVRGRRHPDCAR
jgi:hypothetical protein